METVEPPSAAAINQLLASCQESTHAEALWPQALARSLWHLSILEESSGELVGFVRATSDLALNANLWNLSARPGPDQGALLTVLVHRALHASEGICLDAAFRCPPQRWRSNRFSPAGL